MSKNITYIGIDPAFREAGFCVCQIYLNKTVEFFIITFFEFIELSKTLPIDNVFVGVENSNEQKTTFDQKGKVSIVAKKSRDAGKNMAISQCTFDLCKSIWSDRAYSISPKEKGATWDNDTFLGVVQSEGHILLNYNGNKTEHDKRAAYQVALKAKYYSNTGLRPSKIRPKKNRKKSNSGWGEFLQNNPDRIIKK